MINKTATAICAAVIGATLFAQPSLAGEKEVTGLLKKKVAIVNRLHTKAEKALVNYAQDKIFAEYFTADDAKKPELKGRIDELSLKVQSKFDVAEMCLINDQGHEISRIVGSEIAPADDLSTEEASAPFFAPTFAKAAKEVFVSPVYVSPDVLKWVVAYVTPVVAAEKKYAILHYEHGLEIYQEALSEGVSGDTFVVAVNGDGYVLSDSRGQPDIKAKGEDENPASYFQKLPDAAAAVIKPGTEGQGTFEMDGATYLAAFAPVHDWTVAVIEKQ